MEKTLARHWMMTFDSAITTTANSTFGIQAFEYPVRWIFHDGCKVTKRTVHHSFQVCLRWIYREKKFAIPVTVQLLSEVYWDLHRSSGPETDVFPLRETATNNQIGRCTLKGSFIKYMWEKESENLLSISNLRCYICICTVKTKAMRWSLIPAMRSLGCFALGKAASTIY